MTALTNRTGNDDILALKFVDVLAENIPRTWGGVWNAARLVLALCANIDYNSSGCLSCLTLLPLGARGFALANVVTHVSGLVNGIFCTAKWWCVCQL